MPNQRITVTVSLDLVPGSDMETPLEAQQRMQKLLDGAIPHNNPGVEIGMHTHEPFVRHGAPNPLTRQVAFGD